MSSEEQRFDEFLEAYRQGDEEAVQRLLDDDIDLRRLAELRGQARTAPELPQSTAEPGLPFDRLGDYRLLRRLGEGGMGQLFLATQESLGRKVALKLIQTALLGSATARERFRREALAAARLQHPNLVTVYAAGEEQGVSFIAMEHIEGRGLDEHLKASRSGNDPLDVRRVVHWGARLARALAYAHDRGVLHRDVKPSNVLITATDEPVLIDFGVARDERWTGHTVTRDFTGSLPYAAPEQLAAREVDGRADVYALAATLYEALTGRLPIAGNNLEQLLHDDPTPPRHWNPSLSPDLEVVLLKALAKQPARRYADAAAFAADLEAVLALRPIAARPPSRFERARRWARRRPRAAAALISAAVAVLLFAGYLVYLDRARAANDREEAARLVERARARLADYRERQEGLTSLEARVAELERLESARFLKPDEDALLDQGRIRVASARRDREAAYHEVLQLLRRAERLDPEVARADEVRTDLYMQRWRDARDGGDTEAARFYRDLVVKHDEANRHRAELEARVTFTIKIDPPDAAVYLFRLVEQSEVVPDGERRFVPVPWGDDAELPVPPGSVAWRVVRPVEGWQTEDLVLDHGPPALVWRNGKAERLDVAPGLELRRTAAPLFISERCRLPAGPRHEVPAGRWLLYVRHPDRVDQRLAFDSAEGLAWDADVELTTRTHPGFVHVHGWTIPSYWIMEREVTAAEYLEFLNDPETRQRIDASKKPILYPREQSEKGVSSYWPRDDDGRFRLDGSWMPTFPVVGISWQDANDYAAWRTRRARGVRYRLPTYKQWIRAGNSYSLSHYPFGNHWRPKWVCSCYSRPTPELEPVMGYPIDESPCGVFDMSGSVQEWLADWYDRGRGLRHLVGGSWAHAQPKDFELYGRGTRPELTLGTAGFRLVLEEVR